VGVRYTFHFLENVPIAPTATVVCIMSVVNQMSLLLSKLLRLSSSVQLGLFYAACLPGGGVSYLVASVFRSHSISVSATYNFICTFATLGKLNYFALYFIFAAYHFRQPNLLGRFIYFGPSWNRPLVLMRAAKCQETLTTLSSIHPPTRKTLVCSRLGPQHLPRWAFRIQGPIFVSNALISGAMRCYVADCRTLTK